MKRLTNIHPGEVLMDEFLKQLEISATTGSLIDTEWKLKIFS